MSAVDASTAPKNAALMGAAKSGAAVGLSMGAYSALMEKGGFVIPAAQAGLIAGGVSYLMKGKGAEMTAAACGAAFAVSCGGIQGFTKENCLKYGAMSGVVSYAALKLLAPELQMLYDKYYA